MAVLLGLSGTSESAVRTPAGAGLSPGLRKAPARIDTPPVRSAKTISRCPGAYGGAVSEPRRVSGPPPAGLPGGAAADLVEEVFRFGDREVRLLRPRDGDALLNEVLAEEDPGDERLPFWAELWPSG